MCQRQVFEFFTTEIEVPLQQTGIVTMSSERFLKQENNYMGNRSWQKANDRDAWQTTPFNVKTKVLQEPQCHRKMKEIIRKYITLLCRKCVVLEEACRLKSYQQRSVISLPRYSVASLTFIRVVTIDLLVPIENLQKYVYNYVSVLHFLHLIQTRFLLSDFCHSEETQMSG